MIVRREDPVERAYSVVILAVRTIEKRYKWYILQISFLGDCVGTC